MLCFTLNSVSQALESLKFSIMYHFNKSTLGKQIIMLLLPFLFRVSWLLSLEETEWIPVCKAKFGARRDNKSS